MDKILSFIGLMKKAGALSIGGENTFDAAHTGKAKMVVLASDAAKNTINAANNAVEEREIPLITLSYTKREIGEIVGILDCAALGILQTGFAKSLADKLGETEQGDMLDSRLQREKRRHEKKLNGQQQIEAKRR